MFGTLLVLAALSAVAQANVYTLTESGQTIPQDATVLNIDALGWKGLNTTEKCRIFELPGNKTDGDTLKIYTHHSALSYFKHPNAFARGADPLNSIGGSAEFSWVRVMREGDSIEMEWITYNHGWTIVNTEGHVDKLSWRPHPPMQGYVMLTARRMYENEDQCPDEGPLSMGKKRDDNVPEGLTEMLGTIDLDPRSVEFGQIIHLSPGKPRSKFDYSGEHHHGGIVENSDGELFVMAPSLAIRNSYVDVYSLRSPRAPQLSSFVPREQLQADGLGALHTAHIDPDTGDIMITALGGDTACVQQPAGIARISPNMADAVVGFDFQVDKMYDFLDDLDFQDANAQVYDGGIFGKDGPASYSAGTGKTQFALVNQNPALAPLGFPVAADFYTDVRNAYTYDFTIHECGTDDDVSQSIMVSTAWAPTTSFDQGFLPFGAPYGNHVRVHKKRTNGLSTAEQNDDPELTLVYVAETRSAFEFGMGTVPLEVRRHHQPCDHEYLIGVTLPGALMRLWNNGTKEAYEWKHEPAVGPLALMAHAAGYDSTDPFKVLGDEEFPTGFPFVGSLSTDAAFNTTTLNTCTVDDHEIDNEPVAIDSDYGTGETGVPQFPILNVGNSSFLRTAGAALGADEIWRFSFPPDADNDVDLQLAVPGFGITWTYAAVPLVTDITIDVSDSYVYVACWLAGSLLQYDISDPEDVRLVGVVRGLGGLKNVARGAQGFESYNKDSYIVRENHYGEGDHMRFSAGPQMLRVVPSGQYIYVTNSLFASWDDQFYPQNPVNANGNPDDDTYDGSIKTTGGMMVRINTGVVNGCKKAPMSIDQRFGENGVLVFDQLTSDSVEGEFKVRAHEFHIEGIHR